MLRVTIPLTIPVSISPFIGDCTEAIHTSVSVQIKVSFIARAPALAAFYSNTTFRGVCMLRAWRAVVFGLLLIDIVERILNAELAASRAFLAMSQVARVALSQVIGVAPVHRDRFDLCLHELCEGQAVELGVAPDHSVVAFGDSVKSKRLEFGFGPVFIGELLDVIDEELENTIAALFCPNGILSILELHGTSHLIEVDWVGQIIIHEHVTEVGLVSFERGACA